MSTNRRQRKRQLKMSMRYVDHVMGNMSQKQKDVDKAVKLKETRVEKGDLNKLNTISTEIDSNGNEVDVFDEMLVVEGSKRWEMTVYGYFVGYR
ncbi:hypothetical protein Tco_1199972 [Tanacetum coccineum]